MYNVFQILFIVGTGYETAKWIAMYLVNVGTAKWIAIYLVIVGTGYETAKWIAMLGAKVVLAVRSEERGISVCNNAAASWENQQCGFRTGPTQTGLYKRRKELEARNFGFK